MKINAKKGSKIIKSAKKLFKKKVTKPVSFDKKVMAVIHKQAEDKEAFTNNSDTALVSFNSGINSAGDCLALVPTITTGSGNNSRIGDKINLKTHTVKGYFRIVPNTAALSYKFGNVAVRMLVLTVKTHTNYDALITDPAVTTKLAGLLQKGGTTVGFTGVISDVLAPINRDLFTVHYDKTFNIKQDYNMTAAGSATLDTLRFFSISLKVKNKQLKYTDDVSSGLYPTNYAPIICFGYSFLDGSAPDTASTNLQVYYESIMKYEDL